MEILRYARDAWGREVIEGVSWDLLWVFVGAGLVIIGMHLTYLAVARRQHKEDGSSSTP